MANVRHIARVQISEKNHNRVDSGVADLPTDGAVRSRHPLLLKKIL